MSKPSILFLDIETAPMLGHIWGLWKNDVALNQLKQDWHLLSWSAMWDGQKKPLYKDQRNASDIQDDKDLVKSLRDLMEQADIIVTHAGTRFDIKKLNARFIFHKLKPVMGYKHIDTLVIAKKAFAFTSNKLEYLAKYLKVKTKKLTKREFSGFELWTECMAGNKKAWKEMELYNAMDVLALKDVYEVLRAWGATPNISLYNDTNDHVCNCGAVNSLVRKGYYFTATGKYQKYACRDCGKHVRGRENLLSKEKRANLKINI
jgi:hypothetical protein